MDAALFFRRSLCRLCRHRRRHRHPRIPISKCFYNDGTLAAAHNALL